MEDLSMRVASNLLTRISPMFSDLSKIIKGDIDCSYDTLQRYSTDGSPYEVIPQAVIYPKNSLDIKHVLSFAREYKLPVTVRGKGGASLGGSLSEGIIIDLTRYFSKIRNVHMIENTVMVDSGVTVSFLLETLHSWGFDIPALSYSPTNEGTVGGSLAAKSATPYTFTQGTLREWVESLTVIVDNGEEHCIQDGITPSGRLLGIYQTIFPLLTKENPVIRASKPHSSDEASGYTIWNTSIGPRQLIDQLSGSEGTLGIITSVTFRTIPYKKHTHTTAIPISSIDEIPNLLLRVREHNGIGAYLYDKEYMELGKRYAPTIVPYFLDTSYVLLVAHAHVNAEKLQTSVTAFKKSLPFEEYLLKSFDGTMELDMIANPSFLNSLCESYSNNTLYPMSSTNGLIVTLKQIPSLVHDLESYLGQSGRPSVIHGNIGSGHISSISLFDEKRRLYPEELISYTSDIFSLVKKYNGGVSAINGEGLSKTPFLNLIYSNQMLSIFKKVKEAWDPLFILNPGKKIGTTTSYLSLHTKSSRARKNEGQI